MTVADRVLEPRRVRFVSGSRTQGVRLELCFGVAVLVAAALAVWPVFRHGGWPSSTDFLNPMYRTEIYAAHIRQGDLLPVWSTSDNWGMGSPLLLYYQKLFYYLAGLFSLLTGSVKTSMVIAIVGFLIVGAYGMRSAARRVTAVSWLWFVAPLCFVLANYTFTNWLVRGDLAEFSAMMLVPWVFWWCGCLIEDGRFGYVLIPLAVLLFYAHSAIAMLSAPLVVLALMIRMVTHGGGELRRLLPRLVIVAVAVVVLVGPDLIAQTLVNQDYAPLAKLSQGWYSPLNQFHPLIDYLFDWRYHWLSTQTDVFYDYSVQLDLGITIPILGWLLVAGWQGIGGLRRPRPAVSAPGSATARGSTPIRASRSVPARPWLPSAREYVRRYPYTLLLVVAFVVCLLLQLRPLGFLYTAIGPLGDLQFPWRMLTIMTVSGLLLATGAIDLVYRRGSRRAGDLVVGLWLLSFVALSPSLRSFHDPFIPAADYATPNGQLAEGVMVQQGEYVPTTDTAGGQQLTLTQSDALVTTLATNHQWTQALARGNSCVTTQPADATFEALRQSYTIRCARGGEVALPVMYSRYLRIDRRTASGRIVALPFHRIRTDPRAIARLRRGDNEIVVRFPTLWYILTHP